jgi:hypothetical protein
MKLLKISMALVFSILLLSSCGSTQKKEKQSDTTFDLADYLATAEAIDPNLNKVDQVFKILDLVNAEYNDVLTNDPYSAHSYKFNHSLGAANLGIYMADILYHHYGGNDEAMYLSFAAAQELAKYIGVDSEFGAFTIESMTGTAMNRDTLSHLFNTLLTDSKNYNSEADVVFIHTSFLVGSFVEKLFITSNILREKLAGKDLTKEQEGDIRELLIIYLNQLNPSTGLLAEALEKQKDQMSGVVAITTFIKLKELSDHLKAVKSTLAVAPIADIAANQDLKTTFDLIANLRMVLVTAAAS